MADEARNQQRLIRVFRAYVTFAQKHAGRLLLATALVATCATLLALRLELHTDMSELLPPDHPAVTALRRVAGRQKAATSLVMLVHSRSVDANRDFVRKLLPGLSGLTPSTFSAIQVHPDAEVPRFIARWRWLYAEIADIRAVSELIDRLISARENPFSVDLVEDPEAELARLQDKMRRAEPPRPSEWFQGRLDGEEYLGVLLWRPLSGVATASDRDALDAVERLVARAEPARFAANLKVDFTGPVAIAIDEQDAIRGDLRLASILCIVLVGLAVLSYFRRLWLLVALVLPVAVGLLLSLAFAAVTIRYLNINTAFLISIIVGNGINAPIVLLAALSEQSREERPVAEALPLAMAHAFAGTLTATIAAAVAYASLLATSFRGFSQFGLLGAIGMVLVWCATFVVVPPFILFVVRHAPNAFVPKTNPWVSLFRIAPAGRRRRALASLFVGVTAIGCVVPLVRYARDPLEWNIDRLRSDPTPAQRQWNKMEALGLGDMSAGYIGNKAVLLVDRADEADAVAAAMKAQDAARGPDGVLQTVRTLDSMLPAEQTVKLALLRSLARKVDRHASALGPSAATLRPPDDLRLLTVDDLPRPILDAFTESDGTRGRLIGVDVDRTRYYDFNGHDLLRLASSLQLDAVGRHWVAASPVLVFAAMLQTMVSDAPRIATVAAGGVLLVLFVAFGIRGAAPVVLSLALGLLWLGGALGVMHAKINFMNFVALPITLGVGADYASNLWARARVQASMGDVIAQTGSAVALCSLTTIIGYSSLLLSHNRALRSFGLVADLGELCCLAAALLVIPIIARAHFGTK